MPGRKKPHTEGDVLAKPNVKHLRPKMYAIIMHNDDYTAMDFVVMVLRVVFKKGEADAMRIMQTVHTDGLCKVDTYPLDIALTKKAQTDKLAESAGFPLLLTIEEEV